MTRQTRASTAVVGSPPSSPGDANGGGNAGPPQHSHSAGNDICVFFRIFRNENEFENRPNDRRSVTDWQSCDDGLFVTEERDIASKNQTHF